MRLMIQTVTTVIILTITVGAQKSLSDLPAGHAAAIQTFLAQHPGLKFLTESAIAEKDLKYMRESFGAKFQPYYRKGDFNRDGKPDFAVILVKGGKPKEDKNLAASHRFRYQVTVVIFNGQADDKYHPAFVKQVASAPLVCLLSLSKEKQPKLYFGVFETDEGFVMIPAGKGYRAKSM